MNYKQGEFMTEIKKKLMNIGFILFLNIMMLNLFAQSMSPPLNLQAVAGTDTIVLTWQSAEENSNLMGYKVYRNGVELVGDEVLRRPFFTDTTALTRATYVYFVTSVNLETREESSPSNVIAIEVTEYNAPNTQRTQTRTLDQKTIPKFQTEWKASVVFFGTIIESSNSSYYVGGYGKDGATYISGYPEILYRVSTNFFLSFDIGARLYIASSKGKYSSFNEAWIWYNSIYGEIYSQFRSELNVANDVEVIPYIEPRFLIDQSLQPFVLVGADLKFFKRVSAGIVTDISDIEDIQYRFGIDFGLGKGLSVQPRYILNITERVNINQLQISIGYTF